MMRRLIVLVLALALMAPAAAYAATEFSLGGFIKLNTFWDSTQNGSNLTNPVNRDNDPNFHHGRLNMDAQESRFNFIIKGPELWGAKTSGIFEIDFDGTSDSSAVSASGTWLARLRLAMFRLNWPDTELMMGQYHSIFATWQVDAAESSAFQMTGTVTARLPQIRLTQNFAGDWSVAGLVGLPNTANLTNSNPYVAGTGSNGADAETPQIEGSVKYAHDWYGKAAYFGHPAPFTAQVTAGWQRNINRLSNGRGLLAFGEDNFTAVAGNISQQFVNPWMVQGALFIPVIPTYSPNLAGTASILTQWFVGQGVEAFGVAGNSSNLYSLENTIGGVSRYDAKLLNRFGGFVQGEYYFTNQWYVNAAYGISSCYGVDRNTDTLLADQFKTTQQVDATLWYRPITALKFGLQYSFAQTKWFQNTTTGTVASPAVGDLGNEHRVQFVAFYFF
jgi:hypothetical protein